MKMFSTKKLVLTALFIAIGIILPMAFHLIPVQQVGGIFLPMHIPVLLCGITVGFPYGLACGIITPLLSSLLTGMPPSFILPSMVFELAAYGTVSALLIQYIPVKNLYTKIYISLIGAMIFGRVFFGAINALILNFGNYSMETWLTVAFITALPGIAIQVIVIPAIVIALQKTKLIEITL